MIDLHNHILPGLDDGAADLEESVDIARRFVEEGVATVAATPHFNPFRPDQNGQPVRERVEEVQAALRSRRIDLTVLSGNEILLSPDLPDLLRSGAALSLGDSTAILVEFSFEHRPTFLEDTLFRLEVAGYRPVLAHPERYGYVQRDVDSTADLAGRGVALQLTAASLFGGYGQRARRTAEHLLLRGRYACAASDRHHPEQARSLRDLHNKIAQLRDIETADLLLIENPRRLLDGERVRLPAPVEEPRQRSFLNRLFPRSSAEE
ncbi:MAG: tyrosine-protein phosphatase [Chloroflexota bacterium]|nr:MAG: capsular biosynthesis protein [Chloroflexota bacterium]